MKEPAAQSLPLAHYALQPGSLLSLMLGAAVPIEIDDLFRRYRDAPGIPAWMVAEAIVFGPILAERGDRLLFPGKRKGETADLFVGLSRALTIMSFVAGGVPFGEERYDAAPRLAARYGEAEAGAFCQRALRPYFDAEVATVPVACWSDGSDPTAFGTYNAIRWFELAGGDDLLLLRAQRYRGCATWESDPLKRSGCAHSLLVHLRERAQDSVRWPSQTERDSPSVGFLGDQSFLAACDSCQEIAFQADPSAAEAWLALYRHGVLTGERWLLPPEQPARQKRSPGVQ